MTGMLAQCLSRPLPANILGEDFLRQGFRHSLITAHAPFILLLGICLLVDGFERLESARACVCHGTPGLCLEGYENVTQPGIVMNGLRISTAAITACMAAELARKIVSAQSAGHCGNVSQGGQPQNTLNS